MSLHSCLQHANTEGETGLQEGQKLSIENLWEATAQVGEQLLINSKGGKKLCKGGANGPLFSLNETPGKTHEIFSRTATS